MFSVEGCLGLLQSRWRAYSRCREDTGADTGDQLVGQGPRGMEAGSSPREGCMLREQQYGYEHVGQTSMWGWVLRRQFSGGPCLVGSRPTWGCLSVWTERSPSRPPSQWAPFRD